MVTLNLNFLLFLIEKLISIRKMEYQRQFRTQGIAFSACARKFYFLFTFLIKKENFIKTSTLIQHPFERTHIQLPCICEWLVFKTGQPLQTHYLTFWNVSHISLVSETCSFEIFWSISTWPIMIDDVFFNLCWWLQKSIPGM